MQQSLTPRPPRLSALAGALASLLALILILARTLPVPTAPFGDWPDAGWNWGLDTAVNHGLRFGRDIIFTYGPFVDTATHFYDPAQHGLILVTSLLLGLSLAAGVLALARPWAQCAIAVFLIQVPTTDALAFALPLPALLLLAGLRPGDVPPRRTVLALLALAPGLALLPLAKGSFLPVSMIGAAASCALLVRAGRASLATGFAALSALCAVVLWCAAGQALSDLPHFLAQTVSLAGAHNQAMAVSGAWSDSLPPAAAAAVVFALVLVRVRHMPRLPGLVLAVAIGLLLWLALKAGLTRQDPGHLAVAVGGVSLIGAMLAAWLPPRAAAVAGLMSVALLVWPGNAAVTPLRPGGAAAAVYRAIAGNARLLLNPDLAARDFQRTRDGIRGLPWRPPGTADIYATGQARLLASALPWAPRPMFQSYDAITPDLAALNAAHLTGPAAPDNVFFRVEPIDGRLPALEDGASWPALLSLYDTAGYDGAADLLWLRRAPPGTALAQPAPPLARQTRALGETIPLPQDGPPVWARIDLRASRAGTLWALLARAKRVFIRLDFADGQHQRFRFIPGMAQSGFLLSPNVASTLDFLRLRAPASATPQHLPRPTSFALLAEPGQAWAWRNSFTVSLQSIAIPPIPHPVALQNLPRPTASELPAVQTPGACFLDQADQRAVAPGGVTATGMAQLSGWAVFDRAARRPAEATRIALQGADGALFSAPVAPFPRQDVTDLLGLPPGAGPGFTATLDLTHMQPGTYGLLAITQNGTATHACKLAPSLTILPP